MIKVAKFRYKNRKSDFIFLTNQDSQNYFSVRRDSLIYFFFLFVYLFRFQVSLSSKNLRKTFSKGGCRTQLIVSSSKTSKFRFNIFQEISPSLERYGCLLTTVSVLILALGCQLAIN